MPVIYYCSRSVWVLHIYSLCFFFYIYITIGRSTGQVAYLCVCVCVCSCWQEKPAVAQHIFPSVGCSTGEVYFGFWLTDAQCFSLILRRNVTKGLQERWNEMKRKKQQVRQLQGRYVIFHVGFMNVCVVLYKNKLKPTNG